MLPTNKMVVDLISAETSYVNTGHPDFINGHKAMAIVQERMNQSRQQSIPDVKALTGKGIPPPTNISPRSSEVNLYAGTNIDPNGDGGFFGSFFAKKKKPGVLEQPPSVLKPSGNLSEREYMEVEVISMRLFFIVVISFSTIQIRMLTQPLL